MHPKSPSFFGRHGKEVFASLPHSYGGAAASIALLSTFIYLFIVKTSNSIDSTDLHNSITLAYFWVMVGSLIIWLFREAEKSFLLIIGFNFALFFLSGFLDGSVLNTGGNNDIYNWALSSNTIIGQSEYRNIMPSGGDIWAALKNDASGSYILNGVIPSALGLNSLQLANLHILILSVLTQFALSRLIFLAGFGRNIASLVAISFAASPIYIYLIANYFMGQLIGTLLLFIALGSCTAAHAAGFVRLIRVICLTPPVFVMLVSYQSGFLPLIFAFFFGFLLIDSLKMVAIQERSISLIDFLKNIIVTSRKSAVDLALVLTFVFLLTPESATHLIARAQYVAGVVAGWSLPAINFLTLIGMPTAVPVEKGGSSFALIISLIILAFFFGKSRLFRLTGTSVSFIFVLSCYILYIISLNLNEGPNNYQIWKAATFFLLPLSGFFVAFFFERLTDVVGGRARVVLVFVILFSSLSFYSMSKRYFEDRTAVFHEFVRIQSLVEQSGEDKRRLILDTGDWADTFVAFNVFSKNNYVYPLGQWYGPSVNLADLDLSTSSLLTKDCDAGESNKYRFLDKLPNTGAFTSYHFSGCGLLGRMLDLKGFSHPESTGRWSLGGTSIIQLQSHKLFPPGSRFARLRVVPFLPAGVSDQRFKIFVNDMYIASYALTEEEEINVPIGTCNSCKVSFHFETPMRPVDFSPESSDVRSIALFFKSLKLSDGTSP